VRFFKSIHSPESADGISETLKPFSQWLMQILQPRERLITRIARGWCAPQGNENPVTEWSWKIMTDDINVKAHKAVDNARVAAHSAYDNAKVATHNAFKKKTEAEKITDDADARVQKASDNAKIQVSKSEADAKIAIHGSRSEMKKR
jgi:hypothetical protein